MRTSKTIKTALGIGVAGLLTIFVLAGVALANFTAPTSLSIARTPTGMVSAGTEVNFHGKLSSGHHSCVDSETIHLFRVKPGADKMVGTDVTNDRGKYSIDRKVFKTGKYYTRYNGKTTGVHPNRHICLASRSDSLKVVVG